MPAPQRTPPEPYKVLDLHSDIQLDLARPGGDPSDVYRDRHLAGIRAGGISLRILATISPPPDPTAAAFRHLAAVSAAGLPIARTAAELEHDGETRYVLGLEGAEPYAEDLRLVETFHWAGVRVVGLTWMHPNAVSGACGEPDSGGLTAFGRDLLGEFSAVRTIVDLAHISDAGFADVIDAYDGPLMCSHTCSRTLHDHVRNITDEQARLVAEHGGVIGVCFFPDFLDGDRSKRTIERVVDHTEHFLEIAGEDHVGLGPDWCDYAFDIIHPLETSTKSVDLSDDGSAGGLEGPQRLPAVAEALERRGLPVEKILYGNGLAFLERSLPTRPAS
jgi:membrane dipeptidase